MKRKRRAWKRGLSFLLAVVFLMGSLQLSVLAVEEPTEELKEITFNAGSDRVLSKEEVNAAITNANIGSSKFRAMIAEGATSIGESAFYDQDNMTEITIPEGVTSIGDNAFYWCRGLERITLPDNMSSIGYEAFSGCNNLTEITIPESVTQIGLGSFGYCSSLTAITIPNAVTKIEDAMFAGCSSLTRVTFSENVSHIGTGAFSNCSSLESITLPSGITSIEDETFAGCSSLTSIEIPKNVSFIGFSAFSGCDGLTEIVLPSSVTSIDDGAFMYCANLKSLDMSACTGLTSILKGVVSNCGNLEKVLLGGNNLTFEGFDTSAPSVEITFPANVTVTLQSSVEVTKGQTYIIPESTACVVPSGGTFTNNGKIINNGILRIEGTFQNQGTLEGTGTAEPQQNVEIIASPKSVTYNSEGIDITKSGLFTIPEEAGAVTYDLVSGGTGEGTLNAGLLTVTKAGTFTIQVSTTATSMYNAGTKEAFLTVEKLTPTEADLTYVIPTSVVYIGAEQPVTITKNKELLGDITEIYIDKATNTELVGAPVDVGSFLVKASIAESDFYEAATLSLGSYSITAAPLKITANNLPPAKVGDPIPSFPTEPEQKITADGLAGGDKLEDITLAMSPDMNTAGEYYIVPTNAVIRNNGVDKAGNYTITYENGSLMVEAVPLDSITLPASKALKVEDTDTLTVTYTPINATNKAVTWESSDGSVVTITGTVTGTAAITAVGAGEAIITATSGEEGSKIASCTVTVSKYTPAYAIPTGLTAVCGQKLSEVSLSGGTGVGTWGWENPEAQVGNAGTRTHKAVFTPTDTNKYETVTVDLTITVEKAEGIPTTAVFGTYAISTTDNSKFVYTIDRPTGADIEYKMDNESWQDSNRFDSIEADSTHTFYARTKETESDKAGAEGSVTVTFEKLSQSLLMIADPGRKTYGDSKFTLSVSGGNGDGGVTLTSDKPDILEITDTTATIHKSGTVTITAKKAGNAVYTDVSATLELTIEKKILTITAENKTIKKGEAMPAFTYTVEGLAEGDNLGAVLFSTAAKDSNTPGTYPIIVTGFLLPNKDYYIIYTKDGAITITDVVTGGSSSNTGNTGGGNNNGENNSSNDSSSGDTNAPAPEKIAEQPKTELPILKPSHRTPRKTDKNQGLVYVEDDKDSGKQTDNATITEDTEAEDKPSTESIASEEIMDSAADEAETTAALTETDLVSNNTLWISIAVIVILALGGIAAYIYFMSQKGNEE